MKKLLEPRGIDINYEPYTPFISYFPGVLDKPAENQCDLYAFSYHDVLHTSTATQAIPWLMEASRMNPYTLNVTMNTKTARERGLKDDDTICIENEKGTKITGNLKAIEGQHPLTVGIVGGFGHWANEGISKGVSFVLTD